MWIPGKQAPGSCAFVIIFRALLGLSLVQPFFGLSAVLAFPFRRIHISPLPVRDAIVSLQRSPDRPSSGSLACPAWRTDWGTSLSAAFVQQLRRGARAKCKAGLSKAWPWVPEARWCNLVHQTENSELVRRGRWLSTHIMEIYLQEVLPDRWAPRWEEGPIVYDNLRPDGPMIARIACSADVRVLFSAVCSDPGRVAAGGTRGRRYVAVGEKRAEKHGG